MGLKQTLSKWWKTLVKRIHHTLRRRCIGMDIGASHVCISSDDGGILVYEPCAIAIDRAADRVVAVGKKAAEMVGKAPANVSVLRPTVDSSLTRYPVALKMLQYYIRVATKPLLRPPLLMICLPAGTTERDEHQILAAATEAGAGKTYLVESVLACAWGTGRDVSAPVGRMVVDVGGGTTSVAVVSLGGVVVSESIRVGGDAMDAAIVRYVRERYGVLIGERAAEHIKLRIGALYLHRMVRSVEVRGRNAETGLPQSIILTSKEMIEAMAQPTAEILNAVCRVLERTPDDLLAHIHRDGLLLCGGCSRIYGFGRLIAKLTGVPVRQIKDSEHCCARGARIMLKKRKELNLSPGPIHLQEQCSRREGVNGYSTPDDTTTS